MSDKTKAPQDKSRGEVKVSNQIPVEKRAKGTRLPSGNPTLVAGKADAEKLPENLRALFTKIKSKEEGVKVSVLCPKNQSGRYTRWLCRQLVARGVVKAVPEPEGAKPAKIKATRTGSPRAQKVTKAAEANNLVKTA
jgi:hypothetical protein